MKPRAVPALPLLLSFLSVLNACCPAGFSQDTGCPIVLISIDTCRADHLSCYGFHRETTPNIDAVAEEGVLFTNAFSPVPITLPSHSSMLSGTIPLYHGVHDNLNYKLGDALTTVAELLRDQGYTTAAFVGAFVMDSQFGLDQGFETYNDSFTETRKANDFAFAERPAGEVSHFANRWLQEHAQEPFFLFLHYFDPHIDYAPPEPFTSKYSDDLYSGEIAYADSCIGLVLDQLKSLGVYESALLIITSDHGEGLGEHGETSHSYFIYQSTLRVPLILKPPGGCEGKRIDDPAGLIDIVPTIAGFLDIPIPTDVQGDDLSVYLSSASASFPGRAYYCESLTPTTFGCNPLFGIVHGGWKLIRSTRSELYDLRRDPAETHNLIVREQARRNQLEMLLDDILLQHHQLPELDTRHVLDADSLRKVEALGYLKGPAVRRDSLGKQSHKGKDPKDRIALADDLPKAFSLFSQGYHEEAGQFCDQVLAEYPEVIDAHYLKARIAFALKDLDGAIHHYTEFLRLVQPADDWMRLQPHLDEIHNNLGLCFFRQGKVDKAVRYYRQALDINPDYVEAHANLGNVCVTQGEWEQAIQHFRRALEIQSDFAPAHNNLGFALASTGSSQEAIGHYRQAIAVQPDHAGAHFNLGNELVKQGRPEEAVVELTETVRLQPDKVDAYNNLGYALASLGRLNEATEAYSKALNLDADNIVANVNMGVACLALGEIDSAMIHLTRALDVQPRHPEALRHLGVALARQGRLEEAASRFKQAVVAAPSNPLMHFNLAYALTKLNRLEEAIASYAKALEIHPDYLKAHYNLGKVLADLGRADQAILHFRRALRIDPANAEVAGALAWILATHPDASVRDGTEALRLAKKACEVTGYRAPGLLDTLAAAYAEAGEFQQALDTAEKAMQSAEDLGMEDLVRQIMEHKKGYDKEEPCRDTLPRKQ